MLERGLPKFGTIRSSVALLSKAIATGHLPPPKPVQSVRPDSLYEPADAVLSVQRIAGAIAVTYGLRVGLINVSFHAAMQAAGRVDLGPSDEFFVEVQSGLKGEPGRVAAVLAHEVAHIALHRAELSLGSEADDEILTDCAAVTYGFGVLTLDAYEVTEQRHGDVIHHLERKLGYLTPEEMGLVVALCTRPAPSRYAFKSTAARQAYLWGVRYLRKHIGWPPLAWAPLYRRLLYLARRELARRSGATDLLLPGRSYAFEARDGVRVAFRCPLCAQGLRVPTENHCLSIRCSSCRFTFDVTP